MRQILKLFVLIVIIVGATELIYCQQGDLDTSFNYSGTIIKDISNEIDNGFAVLVQPDNKVLMVGSAGSGVGMARFKENGTIDETFGTNGIVQTIIGNNNIHGTSAVLQSNGKVIVGGGYHNQSSSSFIILRYNANGSLDSSFGTNGYIIPDFGNGCNDIALQEDGKIIAVGYDYVEFDNSFALARFTSEGALDSTFGNGGFVRTPILTNFNELNAVTINSNEKIITAGYSAYAHNLDSLNFAILQYNMDGTLDSTFNSTGIVIKDINNASRDEAESVKVQSDGKIIVVGHSTSNSDSDFAVLRFNPDGSLDTSFNNSGIVLTNISGNSDNAYSVLIQPNGKIIVVGDAYTTTNYDYAIVRYNNDGLIDSTFGLNGKVLTDFEFTKDVAKSACLTPDGKIVAGGYIHLGDLLYDFSCARYLNDLNIGMIDFEENNTFLNIYPNPIRSYATIEYELEKDEKISVTLYNMNGTIIKSFVSKQKREAGNHKEIINFNGIAPLGTYFVSLNNGKSSVEIKIILQ